LYAASQVLGLSAQALSKSFLDVGMSIESIPDTLKESVNYVRSIGGNAKTVFTDVQIVQEKGMNVAYWNLHERKINHHKGFAAILTIT
jgi:hypothetical protein